MPCTGLRKRGSDARSHSRSSPPNSPRMSVFGRAPERVADRSRFLDHPHVIPIYGAGRGTGVLYLAMRYVEGRDLAHMVAEEGALKPSRALDLLSQVAEALDAAHEKRLVHRDVKPSNVLIASSAGSEHCATSATSGSPSA